MLIAIQTTGLAIKNPCDLAFATVDSNTFVVNFFSW